MKKRFLSCCFSLILIFFLFSDLITKEVFACLSMPDTWFKMQYSFDQSTLPEGIEIILNDPEWRPYSLINKNPEPFYIVKEENEGKTYPESGIPDKYEPLYKLLPEQSYLWHFDYSVNKYGWVSQDGEIGSTAARGVEVSARTYTLDGEYMQVYRDDRPSDVEIPKPQKFKILGFYKNQPVEITGTVIYSLNDKYDPKAEEKGYQLCNDLNNTLPTTILRAVIVIVLLVVAIRIFVKIRRKSK